MQKQNAFKKLEVEGNTLNLIKFKGNTRLDDKILNFLPMRLGMRQGCQYHYFHSVITGDPSQSIRQEKIFAAKCKR